MPGKAKTLTDTSKEIVAHCAVTTLLYTGFGAIFGPVAGLLAGALYAGVVVKNSGGDAKKK